MASQAAASPWLQAAASPDKQLQLWTVKEQVVYKDKVTGEVIPLEKIQENMAAIDNLKEKLAQGRAVFRQAMKETEGDYAESCRRSNEFTGGSCSELWDKLSDQKVVCSMVVVCPPCNNKEQMSDNEERLRLSIGQISGFMHSRIVEVWTSRKEIGTVSESFVYVRFPYHMWAKVEELGAKISQVNVGTHHFHCIPLLGCQEEDGQAWNAG